METSLIRIKNDYAQEQRYEDWVELQEYHSHNPRGIEAHMNEICIRAQKAALEKAAETAKFGYGIGGVGSSTQYIVDRASITNPENLIR